MVKGKVQNWIKGKMGFITPTVLFSRSRLPQPGRLWCLAIILLSLAQGCRAKLESTDPSERIRAVENLTDPAVLAKVAIDDEDRNVRVAAVERLSDQAFLAKVAFESSDGEVRLISFKKFSNSQDFDEHSPVAETPTAMYASLLLKIPSACERIPQGFRDRYYSQLLGILNLVVDPTVTKVLGEVKEIKTEWVGTEQLYYEKEGFRFGKPIKATGEEFTVFVEMRNFDLFYTWSTKFPPKMESPIPPPGANLKFIEALVNPLDFARVIRDQLPSATIAKIAIQSDRSILRRAAVESLSDQAILEEIASQDKDAEVRKQAVERLANLRHKK